MDATAHVMLEDLAGYVDGRLDADSRAAVEAHLSLRCPSCSADVVFLRRLENALEAGMWPTPPSDVHRRAVKAFRPPAGRPRPRIRSLAWSAVAAAVMVMGILTFGILVNPRDNVAYAASLVSESGQVEFRSGPNAGWQPASIGQSIPVGAELRIGSLSQAILALPSGDRVLLTHGASVKLTRLTVAGGRWKITLAQTGGTTENDVQADTGDYRVETPAGTAVTRAGRFKVALLDDGGVELGVDEGDVSMAGSFGDVQLSAGQGAQLGPGRAKPTVFTAGLSATPSPRDLTPTPTTVSQDTSSQEEDARNGNSGDGQKGGEVQTDLPEVTSTMTGAPVPSLTVTPDP